MSSSSVSRRGAFRQHPGCKRACTISGHPHIEGAVSGADGFGEGPVAVIVPPSGVLSCAFAARSEGAYPRCVSISACKRSVDRGLQKTLYQVAGIIGGSR